MLSKEISRHCAKYPIKPPAKVSPAPVGSKTSSKGNAGAKKTSPSPNNKAPCSPFLIIRYFGPIAAIFLAAFTREYSPLSWRASSSLIVSTSTLFKTSFNSSKATSIQKFMVSITTNFGLLFIWSKTLIWTEGVRFPSIRNSLSL